MQEERVNEESDAVEAAQASEALQTISFAPSHGQDVLVHFNFNKDAKDDNNTTTILGADDRLQFEINSSELYNESFPETIYIKIPFNFFRSATNS